MAQLAYNFLLETKFKSSKNENSPIYFTILVINYYFINMGKRKHDIHRCFRDESSEDGNKSLHKKIWNFCSWSTFPNATRQKKHILNCNSCPSDVKKI